MLLTLLALAAAADPELPLAPVFADHAVLQRDRPIAVWGRAIPGETIVVRLAGVTARAQTDADGNWRAQLPAQPAGGPYVLEAAAESGRSRVVSDIMIGDVFLCSGQSNMEFPLSKSLDAADAIASASDPDLRLVTVPAVSATRPLREFGAPLDWQRADASSAAEFSAVCWYMAKAIRRETGVPIGLIDASWGGSTIQAWLSPAALDAAGDRGAIDLLALYNRDPAAANLAWGGRWEQWWIDTVSADDRPWLDTAAEGWSPVPAPGLWESWPDPVLADFNGMVWYRTHVFLTAEQAAQPATIDVGAIDEIDQSWINGRPVGTGAGDAPRAYPIPVGTLRAGTNLVTINILDTWDVGGFFGDAARRAITLADGTRVPLDSGWQYRKVEAARPRPPRAPWYPAWGQGTLYNGMIAPLGDYGIRALAWYQGESNADDGLSYTARLRALLADCRATFGAQLPVLVVQLANYGAVPQAPVESDWAAAREAQRRVAVDDPNTGLVVTIDVGDPDDIHPRDKRTVGERLARAARALVYRRAGAADGPQPIRASLAEGRVVVRFRDVDGALTGAPTGFELCGAAAASCRPARATLEGDTIAIAAPQGAARVRYCWGDSPVCHLRDEAVPLSPFELAIAAAPESPRAR